MRLDLERKKAFNFSSKLLKKYCRPLGRYNRERIKSLEALLTSYKIAACYVLQATKFKVKVPHLRVPP